MMFRSLPHRAQRGWKLGLQNPPTATLRLAGIQLADGAQFNICCHVLTTRRLSSGTDKDQQKYKIRSKVDRKSI